MHSVLLESFKERFSAALSMAKTILSSLFGACFPACLLFELNVPGFNKGLRSCAVLDIHVGVLEAWVSSSIAEDKALARTSGSSTVQVSVWNSNLRVSK